MEGAARTFILALTIERFCDLSCVGIDFDHAVDGRAAFVDGLDTGEILLGHCAGRVLARLHSFLQIIDRRLFEFERSDLGRR